MSFIATLQQLIGEWAISVMNQSVPDGATVPKASCVLGLEMLLEVFSTLAQDARDLFYGRSHATDISRINFATDEQAMSTLHYRAVLPPDSVLTEFLRETNLHCRLLARSNLKNGNNKT